MTTKAKNINSVQENAVNASLPNEIGTPSVQTPSSDGTLNPVAGTTRTEAIITCVEIIPSTGSNAGRLMYLINGKHWTRHKPSENHNTLVLEFRTYTTKAGIAGSSWDVLGTANDACTLTVDAKIAKLTAFDATYAMAIASLLK